VNALVMLKRSLGKEGHFEEEFSFETHLIVLYFNKKLEKRKGISDYVTSESLSVPHHA